MQKYRCSSLPFKALVATQFWGALNDNYIRLLASSAVLIWITDTAERSVWLSAIQLCFFIPFLVFSPLAGSLSDYVSKALVVRTAKFAELFIAVAGGYFLLNESLAGLLFVIFLMGVHSAFFSPAKYGSIPEILEPAELSRGNGFIELWSFIAILLGTVCGTLVLVWGGVEVAAAATVLFAACGLLCSFFVAKIPAVNSSNRIQFNPIQGTLQTLSLIKVDRSLVLTLYGICWFWGLGILLQMSTLLYAQGVGAGGEIERGTLLALLAIGIALGSTAAGKLSEGKVELGLVPLGSIGIATTLVLLSLAHNSLVVAAGLYFFLGLSSGFFIVPLSSYLQQRSPDDKRASYIAFSNIATYLAMLVSAGIFSLLVSFAGLSARSIFLIMGLTTLMVTVISCKVMPETMLRCINWILSHSIYRVKIIGRENVPLQGGVLLISNHIAYSDPPLLLAAIPRPIRFLMFRAIYEKPLINRCARIMQAIPVSENDGPKELLRSLMKAREYLEQGEVVCIFAEGALTRIGTMLPFNKGFQKVVKGLSVPIIPVHLDCLWGSSFSHRDGKAFHKLPKRIPYPVTISFGKPLAADAGGAKVRSAIQELAADAFPKRDSASMTLSRGFVQAAKKNLFKKSISDSQGRSLRYYQLLAGSLALSKLLSQRCSNEKNVAVLLPPCAPATLVNVALTFLGKVPVNLNYTASAASLQSTLQQSEAKTILTSKAFIEKAAIERTVEMVFVEDLFGEVPRGVKIRGLLATFCLPTALIEKLWLSPTIKDDLATIIFSSGSTGEPKGVMLTHQNIASNIEALCEVFQLRKSDCIVGVLPFFHSFGFTGTLWLPLLSGIRAIYHGNPVDAGVVGEITENACGTILLATPTFLTTYLRKCTTEQFKSLRMVVAGAEKLKERIANSFFEKFKVMPLEGYGCTELSPVAMLNIPSYSDESVTQTGNKLGSVGHPLPGIAVKVVNPETGELLGPDQEGLLKIKGPNVMKGYWKNETKTQEVLHDGWYITGDIAKIDADGFVFITDRLSRFSKIGGEMVPHIKIEEQLLSILETNDPCVVISAVPHEKKGEQLVVLHSCELDAVEITKKLSERGLPNLWIPKRENFFKVDQIPVLGSGKMDLREIKKMATTLVGE